MINKFTTAMIVTCPRQGMYVDISQWQMAKIYSQSYSHNISMWQKIGVQKHAQREILDGFNNNYAKHQENSLTNKKPKEER